jgi:hypothetical protein
VDPHIHTVSLKENDPLFAKKMPTYQGNSTKSKKERHAKAG